MVGIVAWVICFYLFGLSPIIYGIEGFITLCIVLELLHLQFVIVFKQRLIVYPYCPSNFKIIDYNFQTT